MAMNAFVKQQQTINQEWDQFHQEFDHWRAGLTSCHRSSAQEALQSFAASFNSVTEQARDIPRTSVTQKLADILIAAAEAEATAFRQLRDRWQPNAVSLFEQVEKQRSHAARAQNEVEDLALELQEKFEEGAEPEEVRAVEEFSGALDAIKNDWNKFHDDYAELQWEVNYLDTAAVIGRLEHLIAQFDAVVKALSGLPSADATESMIEMLGDAAEAERLALFDVHDVFLYRDFSIATPTASPWPGRSTTIFATPAAAAPTMVGPGGKTGSPLDNMGPFIRESEAVLKEVSRTIKLLVGNSPAENLADVWSFNDGYRSLLVEWDAFHQRYNHWQETEGGCDRTEVLQSLDQFNLRAGELGRKVRDLPQSNYLLPMYNLLVEAVEREEGAIRALHNSWRPFTVDAFKAADQERVNANRLRRQAGIGLQGLRDRS